MKSSSKVSPVFISIGTFTESAHQEWFSGNEDAKIYVIEFNPILYSKLKDTKSLSNNKNLRIYQTTVGYEDVPKIEELKEPIVEQFAPTQNPQTPQTPQTQQNPQASQNPQTPQTPQTPQSTKVLKYKTRFKTPQIDLPSDNDNNNPKTEKKMLAFLDQYVKEKNKKVESENSQSPQSQIKFKTIDYNIPTNNGKSVNFYIANYLTSSSILNFTQNQDAIKAWKYPPGARHFKTIKILETPMIRLDTFFVKNKIKNVEFIRINSQGYCLQILQSLGSKIKDVKEFAIKVSTVKDDLYENQSNRKEDIINFLKNHNFRAASVEKISYNQEEMIWFVNIGLEKIVGTKFYSFRTIS